MSRPLIGVTVSHQGPSEERDFARTSEIAYCDLAYTKQIETAGGMPLLIPFVENDAISEIVERLDGLLLSGGDDIHPRWYSRESLADGVCSISEIRDAFEMMFAQRFIATGKPILAICRGFQLLNVLYGGTLIQDLPSQAGIVHHTQAPPFNRTVHAVVLKPDSFIAEIFGESVVSVNSTHHQAVDNLGKDLTACGWSEEGIVEAIEDLRHRFLVGVQWHPERLGQNGNGHAQLFRRFIEACRDKQV
ncbi:MAG: gamma-glutamyl-gamma-aminobutyrate hydrolase family protein [Calditrichota bacterium]